MLFSAGMVTERVKPEIDRITSRIIGAAIEVHRNLGPGLLESAYEPCLAREFDLQHISYFRQLEIPVVYKGAPIGQFYRADFLVEGSVIVEVKAVETVHMVFYAQTLTYMRLTHCKVGLILNFNEAVLKDGIKRLGLFDAVR